MNYGDELIAQSSTCCRSCPDGPTAQICPVGSLKNNALETATVLSNAACPTGTQIRASAGAGSQGSQSTKQHNSPKELTKLLRGNARWQVLTLIIQSPLQRRETEAGANGFHSPPPLLIFTAAEGTLGLTVHKKHLTPSNPLNHRNCKCEFLPQ